MSQIYPFRLPQIKSFSIITPDANIILHYVFDEEEFKPKIEYFLDVIKREKIACEILPAINVEITKRLFLASGEYVKTVRRCRLWVGRILQQSLKSIQIRKDFIGIIEEAFTNVMAEIGSWHRHRRKRRINALRRARIVETAIMLEVFSALGQSKQIDLATFFERLEDKFAESYNDFCKKQSLLFKDIDAQVLRQKDILASTQTLRDIISKKCGVRNLKDTDFLCQSVSRMYQTNKWCSVVTTDYGDIIKNRVAIDEHTLLTCCDPLYFLYNLDKKIDLALRPKDGGAIRKIPYSTFIIMPKPTGII